MKKTEYEMDPAIESPMDCICKLMISCLSTPHFPVALQQPPPSQLYSPRAQPEPPLAFQCIPLAQVGEQRKVPMQSSKVQRFEALTNSSTVSMSVKLIRNINHDLPASIAVRVKTV